MHRVRCLIALCITLCGTIAKGDTMPNHLPRLLVTTDIGGDPDDTQSLIRLLLHADCFDIVGLVASSAGIPKQLREPVTRADIIHAVVDDYAAVLPNLRLHSNAFPDAEKLRAVIRSGNARRGRVFVGEGHDTEASAHIIRLIDESTAARPLCVSLWGGQTDFAQALRRIRETRGNDALQNVAQNIMVYDIADQDELFSFIRELAPAMHYVLSKAAPGRDSRQAVFRGFYLGGDASLTSRAWVDAAMKNRSNPLGERYPTQTWTAPNPHSCIKEGDTVSWLAFLDNGLCHAARPDWGGWGGRFAPQNDGALFRDAADVVNGKPDIHASVWRWRPAIQNAFRARLDWCTETYANANHFPVAMLNGTLPHAPVFLNAKPGDVVELSADGSHDPDGDALSFNWWCYTDAAASGTAPEIATPHTATTRVTIPPDAATRAEFHIILEVTDHGTPPLTAYRRAIITTHD